MPCGAVRSSPAGLHHSSGRFRGKRSFPQHRRNGEVWPEAAITSRIVERQIRQHHVPRPARRLSAQTQPKAHSTALHHLCVFS